MTYSWKESILLHCPWWVWSRTTGRTVCRHFKQKGFLLVTFTTLRIHLCRFVLYCFLQELRALARKISKTVHINYFETSGVSEHRIFYYACRNGSLTSFVLNSSSNQDLMISFSKVNSKYRCSEFSLMCWPIADHVVHKPFPTWTTFMTLYLSE